MQFVYDDGGRKAAGFTGDAGDCVTRAIAIATGKPYQEVYDALHAGIKEFAKGRSRAAKRAASGGGRKGTTPRNGVHREVYQTYLESLGWVWVPTMTIGQGCNTHLAADELPAGRVIARVSKHVCAVIDGVLRDTSNCARAGERCVYGYFVPPPSVVYAAPAAVTAAPVAVTPEPIPPATAPDGPEVYIERRMGGVLERRDRRPRYCAPHRATGLRGSDGAREWDEPEKVIANSYHIPKGGVVSDIRRATPEATVELAAVETERKRLKAAIAELNKRERDILARDWDAARPVTVAELKADVKGVSGG